jgi:hypothetical protein
MSGQLHKPAALPQAKEHRVPIGYEAGWAPEPVSPTDTTHTLLSVCISVKLLLVLASTVILGSEFRGAHGHILLSDHYGSDRLLVLKP